MVRRSLAIITVALTALSFTGARADAPVPELGVISPEVGKVIPGGECSAESSFDAAYPTDVNDPDKAAKLHPLQADAAHDGPAYEACQRLKVVFGPIQSKPGQNDVLIQPVTFEKPLYDGYITRFKPDLVSLNPVENGAEATSPRVKDLHLHHGTWLNPGYFGSDDEYLGDSPAGPIPNPGRTYGRGPWIASGEEKTVAIWPDGFGLKIKQTDVWLFLHMIHNATAETFPVWVTYDIDYIPAPEAEATRADDSGLPEIIGTEGIWLDVGDCSWSNECEKDQFNPIFNVQRGYNAGWDGQNYSLEGACVFPRENCSSINTFADKSAQQGIPLEGPVYDEITIHKDGTLVMMGGHLHNGGLRDNVYLVRPQPGPDGEKGTEDDIVNEETDVKLIHISDAYYFDHDVQWDDTLPNGGVSSWDPQASKIGAPPVSWDFVMTGVTADLGWRVNVKKGDKLRLEGVYDSTIASWYEQMGIVMTWLVPETNTGDAPIGVDPFDPAVDINEGLNTAAVQPGTIAGYDIPGAEAGECTNSGDTLCVRGQMTHPRIRTSGDHYGCPTTCQNTALEAPDGEVMTDIPIGGFSFGPAEMGVIGTFGIPLVKVNEPVTFWNLDTPAYMWHTVTRCALPCSGPTTASYPIADGAWQDVAEAEGTTVEDLLVEDGPDPMDFDSGQMGYGTGANNKLEWEFTPTRTGTFAFYCRIHPSMRGAVRVVA